MTTREYLRERLSSNDLSPEYRQVLEEALRAQTPTGWAVRAAPYWTVTTADLGTTSGVVTGAMEQFYTTFTNHTN